MLTTYHNTVPLSQNLGALTSWNPVGHSRAVTGLIYIFRDLPDVGDCASTFRSKLITIYTI